MGAWQQRLREARRRAKLSQRALAERAGVSLEAIRAYEVGRRRPTREHLIRLVNAIDMNRHDANEMLEAAGHAPIKELTIPADLDAWHAVAEVQAVADRCPWPVFAVNEFIDVVAANAAFQALAGVDLTQELTDLSDRNLLVIASTPRFADHIENWDEVIAILIAVTKGNFVRPADLDDPSPYFKRVFERFMAGDPGYVGRFVKLWDSVELLPAKQRWEYPVIWQDGEFGRMRFRALVYAGDDPKRLFSFNDWIPVDAGTWTALEQVKARAAQSSLH